MRIKRFSKSLFLVFAVVWLSLSPNPCFALEPSPGTTDKEIVERLVKLEEGFINIEKRIEDTNQCINDLRSDMNNRFDDMNSRFNTLQWMFGLFITIALAIFASIGKVLWDLNRRQAAMETSLETQKDELAFLKSFIEKLLPPRGVL